MTKILVRVADAAAMLSVSETWFRENVLPALRKIAAGNGTRVDVEDLRLWVDRRKAGESIGTVESGASGLRGYLAPARGLEPRADSASSALDAGACGRIVRLISHRLGVLGSSPQLEAPCAA